MSKTKDCKCYRTKSRGNFSTSSRRMTWKEVAHKKMRGFSVSCKGHMSVTRKKLCAPLNLPLKTRHFCWTFGGMSSFGFPSGTETALFLAKEELAFVMRSMRRVLTSFESVVCSVQIHQSMWETICRTILETVLHLEYVMKHRGYHVGCGQ